MKNNIKQLFIVMLFMGVIILSCIDTPKEIEKTEKNTKTNDFLVIFNGLLPEVNNYSGYFNFLRDESKIRFNVPFNERYSTTNINPDFLSEAESSDFYTINFDSTVWKNCFKALNKDSALSSFTILDAKNRMKNIIKGIKMNIDKVSGEDSAIFTFYSGTITTCPLSKAKGYY